MSFEEEHGFSEFKSRKERMKGMRHRDKMSDVKTKALNKKKDCSCGKKPCSCK